LLNKTLFAVDKIIDIGEHPIFIFINITEPTMKKSFKLLLALCLCTNFLFGVNSPKTDSFYSEAGYLSIEDSIDILLQLSVDVLKSNPPKAYIYAERAQKISKHFKIDDKIALSCYYMGKVKVELEDYFQAKKYLNDALPYFKFIKDNYKEAEIDYSIAISCFYLGEYDESLKKNMKALYLYNELNKKQDAANTLQNIGLIHHALNDFNKATYYYEQSLEINKKLLNDTNVAGLYQNLGIIYYRNNKYDKALNYYEKSISLFEKLRDTNGIATTFSNIGLIHLDQGDTEKAFKSFEKSKQSFEKMNYKLGQMWALYNMGTTKISQHEYEPALKYIDQSLAISKEINSPEGQMSNIKALSDLNIETSNYKPALDYFIEYTNLRDSIQSAKSKDKIAELETLYNLELKEKQLTESRAELKWQKTQKIVVLSLLCILLFALVFIYLAYHQKKKAESKLEIHKESLENIIIAKSKELKNQIIERKIAEESDNLKSAFLANMSHELRTPMNAIIAFTNFLHDPKLTINKRNEYLEHITTAGDNLLRLIDDIIDIAKIEARQIKIFINPVNVSRLTREIYKVFTELKKKKNFSLTFLLNIDNQNDFIVNTDSLRLKQILSNLIDNAFKYTRAGTVEFGYIRTEDGLEFFVKDTGIGIPKDKQEKIFERFSQLEYSLDRKFGGTGLGLAISKNLSQLLGGKIWVESQPEIGSTFYVRIPFSDIRQVPFVKEPAYIAAHINGKDYNWETKTILIAEDEELNVKVLDTCLTKTNVKLLHARDGKRAVEICRMEKVDLVLMDVQMPVMDGYIATSEIKKMNSKTPIIAQTSFAMANEKEKCIDAGCDDYITKPLDLDILLSKISRYMY
jgi:signal transduction histidine kinase/CheY-like chemotaxis protein